MPLWAGQAVAACDAEKIELREAWEEALLEIRGEDFDVIVAGDDDFPAAQPDAAVIPLGGRLGVVDANEFMGLVAQELPQISADGGVTRGVDASRAWFGPFRSTSSRDKLASYHDLHRHLQHQPRALRRRLR
jgi:hypothetical protein